MDVDAHAPWLWANRADIPRLLARALAEHTPTAPPDLDALLSAEAWGRRFVDDQIATGART